MPGKTAVVTLRPVYFPDTLPFRSLTLSSDSDAVKIGRASKCESKNLVPARDNAWFDSRVMSRQHAKLWASPRAETIYIRDSGSMHGTYVNDRKIPVGQDTAIRSGDVLTFGSEVTRGSETFAPLKVRCECRWYVDREENPPTHPQRAPIKRATNCFSVPEDDDDVVEVVNDSAPANQAPHTVSAVPEPDDDSGSNSDSDVPREEGSSPATSPLRNDTAARAAGAVDSDVKADPIKTSDPDESERRGASQQSPILLDGDQPLVTPTMTPPPPTSTPGAFPSTDDASSHVPDGHSDSESMQVSLAGDGSEDSDPWDYEEEQLFKDGSGSDDESNASSMGFNSDSPSVPYDLPYAETESDSDAGEPDSAHLDMGRTELEGGNNNAQQASGAPPFEAHPRSFDVPQNSTSYNPAQYQGDWTAGSRNNHAPSSSYKHMEKILNPHLPSYACTPFSPSFGEWTGPSGLNHASQVSLGTFASTSPASNVNSYMTYADVSFTFNQQRLSAHNTAPSNGTTLPGPANLANHGPDDRLDRPCSKSVDNHNDLAQPGPHAGVESGSGAVDTDPAKSNPNEKPPMGSTPATTRVSIADIVDESTSEGHYAGPKNPLKKRKADDLDLDSVASEPADLGGLSSASGVCSDGTSSLPDAQPQTPVKGFDYPVSQLTTISAVPEPERSHSVVVRTRDGEPCRKRVKIREESGRGSFAKYAASALVGAVFGGIGTVAALASLPPDFFGVQTG
ncbi:hypothetical protein VTN02DRAFT_5519 [Thermoascus thermophilus]